jgi:hypothetical protein
MPHLPVGALYAAPRQADDLETPDVPYRVATIEAQERTDIRPLPYAAEPIDARIPAVLALASE